MDTLCRISAVIKQNVASLRKHFGKKPKQQALQLQQNADCRILQLPPELLLTIASQLGPVSLALFSETCHRLREVLGKTTSSTIAQFNRRQHVEFLSIVARDQIDQWFCDRCMSFHPVRRYDNYGFVHTNFWPPGDFLPVTSCRIKHRHVQLALKYTRMEAVCRRRHRQILRRLLAPFHFRGTVMTPHYKYRTIRYSCYPKIAMAHDGRLRYLLLTVLRFHKPAGWSHSTKKLGEFCICKHQEVNRWEQSRISWGISYELATIAVRTANVLGKRGNDTSNDISRCEEVTGACPKCPLDFSVRAAHRVTELRMWQDLGPEGAISDLAFNVHTTASMLILYHDAGSIRALYEEDKTEK